MSLKRVLERVGNLKEGKPRLCCLSSKLNIYSFIKAFIINICMLIPSNIVLWNLLIGNEKVTLKLSGQVALTSKLSWRCHWCSEHLATSKLAKVYVITIVHVSVYSPARASDVFIVKILNKCILVFLCIIYFIDRHRNIYKRRNIYIHRYLDCLHEL